MATSEGTGRLVRALLDPDRHLVEKATTFESFVRKRARLQEDEFLKKRARLQVIDDILAAVSYRDRPKLVDMLRTISEIQECLE